MKRVSAADYFDDDGDGGAAAGPPAAALPVARQLTEPPTAAGGGALPPRVTRMRTEPVPEHGQQTMVTSGGIVTADDASAFLSVGMLKGPQTTLQYLDYRFMVQFARLMSSDVFVPNENLPRGRLFVIIKGAVRNHRQILEKFASFGMQVQSPPAHGHGPPWEPIALC